MDARPRKDRDARREAILDVAADVFMEEGYAAASMSTIAARLGGSKGTLYNYFKNKEELFGAYVARHCVRQQEAMDELVAQASDIRDALTSMGRTMLTVVVDGIGRRNFAVIVAETDRSPQLGLAFYESGPMQGHARVTLHIERAIARGELEACNAAAAAHQFIALCQNRLFKARLCGYGLDPTPADIDAEVKSAVDTFLAAFAPRPPPPPRPPVE